jgi:DNA helicase-2/ATP-dependent DNA helicase PcrA
LPYALKNSLQNYVDLEGVDYDLLIVDEYQDLNACDLELLRLISERGCSVVGAGDDDQSIYNFRKAAPEGIRRFLEDYPGAADYALSITQRCGRSIVDWANYVICGDPDRPKSRQALIPSDSCPAGKCALLSFANEAEEAESVALLVQKLAQNVPPSEILVLLRGDYNGAFSKPLKEALTKLKIPFSDPDAVRRMLEEPNNRQLIEVLRLLVDREDSLSWASLLVLTDGVGPAFFEYIYSLARETHLRFGQALLDAYARDFSGGPTSSAAKAHRLIKEILKWIDAKSAEKEEDGWGAWILSTAKAGIAPAPSKELAELLLALDDLVEEEQGLGRYLSQIAPLGRDRAQAESKGVRIMTMGGAKGLTVEATIVMAAEDGVIPRPDCETAEERRLLYVAMTRAKRYLFVTWARRRKGPTARAGAGARERRVGVYRRYSHFLDGGPVKSEEGTAFIGRFLK